MSGKSSHADGKCRVKGPGKLTIKRLCELNGKPPWTLEVPYPDILPDKAIDMIGCLEMNGVRFLRARERDWDDCEVD